MMKARIAQWTLTALLAAGATTMLRAADAPTTTTNQAPSRQEWQKLSPEERQVKINEMRARMGGSSSTNAQDIEARRKVMRERLDKQIEDLKKKKTDGTITTNETVRLQRLEEWVKRWDQSGTNINRGVPARPAAAPAPKPADQPEKK